MKNQAIARTIFFILVLISKANAQCANAQINWDELDFYFNSGGSRPYVSYVTDGMEMTQKFAFGPNILTIATSSNALINPGSANGVSCENALHTGDLAGYTGRDVQFNPSAANQTITLTFATAVTGLNFCLYDVDAGQRVDFTSTSAINMALQGTTNLTAFNNNTNATYVTSNATNAANNVNTNSVIVSVAGSITSLTIKVTTVGTDAVFWLSDINACVTGSFPTSYNQTGSNEPVKGAVTGSDQPDYFIITPDNDSAFMVDPATGKSWYLFSDASNTYMNSFGYDPYNHYLYYISEGTSLNANNKTLKRYDFNTETSTTLTANLVSLLNIPTMDYGVESASASFYNGCLFIGLEGGKYDNSNTRESIVYRITFDASGIPNDACQVWATDMYSGSNFLHDWADIVIQDGILYDYNSRPGTTIISYEHYNMITGQSTTYLNPNASVGNAFQAGLTWSGNQYTFSSGTLNKYNKDGTVGSSISISSAEGRTWKSGAGDASENFRPKMDFGDAPASYDPVANQQAVHERFDSIRLGTTWDKEWIKKGVSATEDTDDGIGTVTILPPGGGGYLVQVSAYNHSGANATLIAWLDYNGNGTFDASEAITPITVPSSTSQQLFWLFWPSTPNTFTNGQFTYLRVRITSAAAGMNANHAIGWFRQGEVEDYKVLVDNFPLSTQFKQFNANLSNGKVSLHWECTETSDTRAYVIQRSTDNMNWKILGEVKASGNSGEGRYDYLDATPIKGISYYRLIKEEGSRFQYSETRKVNNSILFSALKLSPNPASTYINLQLESRSNEIAELTILDMHGRQLVTKNVELRAGLNYCGIDLPFNAPNGVYVLQLKTATEHRNERFLIKKN